MPGPATIMKGKVHGRVIELDSDPGLRDGTDVRVRIESIHQPDDEPAADEGLRRSAGAWAEDAEELDTFIEDVYRARRDQRSEAGT